MMIWSSTAALLKPALTAECAWKERTTSWQMETSWSLGLTCEL